MNTEPRSSTEIIISALHIIARDLEFTESAAVCEAAGRLEELDQQVRQLQGDNKALKEQNQYLRQRPDLPVDRIPAYQQHAEHIKTLQKDVAAYQNHLWLIYTNSDECLYDGCMASVITNPDYIDDIPDLLESSTAELLAEVQAQTIDNIADLFGQDGHIEITTKTLKDYADRIRKEAQ